MGYRDTSEVSKLLNSGHHLMILDKRGQKMIEDARYKYDEKSGIFYGHECLGGLAKKAPRRAVTMDDRGCLFAEERHTEDKIPSAYHYEIVFHCVKKKKKVL